MIKKVIFSTPAWHLNGINVFTSNLAKQLIKEGYEVEILLTQKDIQGVYREKNMVIDKSLPIKEFKVETQKKHYWKTRWKVIRQYLEDNAPCIYIPNYDFYHAAICPILSDDILVIGIVHSDDELHYEQTKRLGRFWNAIVTVSDNVHKTVQEFDHYNNDKLFKIDYGVYIAEEKPIKSIDINSPIKLVYSGRLNQHQKRVLDLPKIMQKLLEKKVNFEFNIIGNGSDGNKIKKACSSFVDKGTCKFHGSVPNDKVFEILRESDLFILTSEFEGKPLALIEAMGQGCIPIVSDIQSGIPELIDDGENGFKIPVGDIDKFADCIENLYNNRDKVRDLSTNAYQKVNSIQYKIETMTKKYIEVFNFALARKINREFIRPHGDIYPPKFLLVNPDILHTISWKITAPLRLLGNKIFLFKKYFDSKIKN